MNALAYPMPAMFRRVRPSPTPVSDAHYKPFVIDYVSEFRDLIAKWKDETALFSNMQDMMDAPSFMAIVRLGDKAVPLIVSELRREPSFLFLALHAITRENPVPDSAQGNIGEIIDAWLTWASRNRRYAD